MDGLQRNCSLLVERSVRCPLVIDKSCHDRPLIAPVVGHVLNCFHLSPHTNMDTVRLQDCTGEGYVDSNTDSNPDSSHASNNNSGCAGGSENNDSNKNDIDSAQQRAPRSAGMN